MSPPERNAFILVVEDDPDLAESIVEILEDNSYRPVRAVNGRDALERLRAAPSKPSVILLDVMMPIMDGLEFRAIQRADPELSSIPVVILSAHVNIEKAAQEMGADASLKKPIQLKALLTTVGKFCRAPVVD